MGTNELNGAIHARLHETGLPHSVENDEKYPNTDSAVAETIKETALQFTS
jgi:hypothetical protein